MTESPPDTNLAPYRTHVAGGGGGEGRAGFESAPEEAAPNPLELVRERMHGRWLWAILLAVLLAPMGAAAGYFLTPKKYTAEGFIYAQRRLDVTTLETPETARLDDFASFVGDQAVLAGSERVITAAAQDPRLNPFRARFAGDEMRFIKKGLQAQAPRNTSFVAVTFESDDPALSAAVANSVLEAYGRIAAPNAELAHTQKIRANEEAQALVRNRINAENEERLRLIRSTPDRSPDITDSLRIRVERVRQREQELAALQDAMGRIRRSLDIPDGQEPPADALVEPTQIELDRVNPALVGARQELDRLLVQLEQARRNYGERHPIRQQAARSVELAEARRDRELQVAIDAWRAGVADAGRYGQLAERSASLAADIERIRIEIGQLVDIDGQIAAIGRRLAQHGQEEELYAERLKELNAEGAAIRRGRVETTLALTPVSPSSDKRIPASVAGAIGMVGLSFGLFFLLGTFDRRTYGTVQLITQKGKLLLAGAIPDMEEVTGDLEGTELATNCVHRIRTRIESRRTPGDGYALMISSPFQGDGKTTVAVALAWSYAESGSRTLLVDCDFIGQALSFQFGKLGVPGVREALQGRPVPELIAGLKNDKLSVLPIGIDRAFGAARAHPAALRRLFHDLRKEFEIIVVDTGPMTASIEALPVASAVDGVLLSLRRGRSRSRLEECIQDILSVGAEYLGMVLNCAEKRDCIRYGSVSRLSTELSRALEGKAEPPPKHPLLNAMRIDDGGATPGSDNGEERR